MPQINFLSDKFVGEIKDHLAHRDAPTIPQASSSNFFWNLRPIVLKSEWEEDEESPYGTATYYSAQGLFYGETEVEGEEQNRIKVYSISDAAAQGDVLWCVYRGRWEAMASLGGGGHYIRETTSDITSSSTVHEFTINGETISAKCPLLKSGDEITSGSKVVLSKNLGTGEWEIIEAQCPE